MRSGISRIETILLILLVLGGAALTFVYLYRSREDARRVDCLNRMRQIATAAHNYHDSHKRLPAGTLGNPETPTLLAWENGLWKDQQCSSTIFLLHHFLDLRSGYFLCDKSATDYRKTLAQYNDVHNIRRYEWFGEIPGFMTSKRNSTAFIYEQCKCPADADAATQNDARDFTIMTQPVFDLSSDSPNTKMYTMRWSSKELSDLKQKAGLTELKLFDTNYLGCYGIHSSEKGPDSDYDEYGGAMTVREKVTLDELSGQDGQTYTFMMGETVGEIIDDQRTQVQSLLWGGLAHGFGDFQWETKQSDLPFLGDARNASVYGFGSMHRNAVNFSLCDASVHSLNRNIDIEVYRQMCGRNDGGPIE
jgi:hypothetical protein